MKQPSELILQDEELFALCRAMKAIKTSIYYAALDAGQQRMLDYIGDALNEYAQQGCEPDAHVLNQRFLKPPTIGVRQLWEIRE